MVDCLRCQVIDKCLALGLLVSIKDLDVVIATKTTKHCIFISDMHIEAWDATTYRDINHSDWLGTIDTIDEYLEKIE